MLVVDPVRDRKQVDTGLPDGGVRGGIRQEIMVA